MKRPIACAIDDDIIGAVRNSKVSNRRALYDVSVVRALRRLGEEVRLVPASDPAERTVQELLRLRPSLVFNLAFSATPAEPAFAGLLEILGLPFTGSGAYGIALSRDKIRSRQLLQAAGIGVPPFIVIPHRRRARTISLQPPFLVKPNQLANSLGVRAGSVVSTYAQAKARADVIWRRFQVPSLCDTFIVGREFQVGLIERRGSFETTAIMELHFAGAERGHGFKSESVRFRDEFRRVHDVAVRVARLPRRVSAEMEAVARRAAEVLDFRGYAKIDLRLDDHDRLFVLEANANPGLWSGLPIWRRGGFAENVAQIVAAARRRARE
jgi:D-alanine-D-alanine ligase